MNIIRTNSFEQQLSRLPQEAERLFSVQEKRFGENWQDPRLHIKKLRGFKNVFSFRVTRNWRVLFYFQNPVTAVFFDIDNRRDIYR